MFGSRNSSSLALRASSPLTWSDGWGSYSSLLATLARVPGKIFGGVTGSYSCKSVSDANPTGLQLWDLPSN